MSMDNNVLESARAREIVQVILDFGVSELQKNVYIIQDIAQTLLFSSKKENHKTFSSRVRRLKNDAKHI